MRSRDSRTRGSSDAGWTRDLGLVVALVAITNIVLFGVDAPRAVVLLVGVPFLLLLPGYAVVSALFPEDTGRLHRSEPAQPWDEPDHLVRLGLSLVVSAVVVALVGVVLSAAAAIALVPAVVAISVVTVLAVVVAAIRRLRVDPAERAMPLGDGSRFWDRLGGGSTIQSGAAAVALLVLVATLAVTGAAPSQGDAYTEFYLLSENEDGSLTAESFPENVTSGETESLYVGIENNEHEPKSYEVVMLAQAVDEDGSVIIQQQVDRFEAQLAHGEDITVEREVAPTIVGQEIRLRVLLYEGSAPDNPSEGTADQTLQIWIDVVEG